MAQPTYASERDGDGIRVERIAGACGAIVTGFELCRPQLPDEIERLRSLLDEYLVVAIADQELDLDQLERFTDELGGRDTTPFVASVPGRPFVVEVLKEAADQLNFANAWHTDLSYLSTPPSYTVLHAWEVPAFGGDTMWANQYLAYESLPSELRARLLTMRATHSAGMAYGTGGYLEQVADRSSMKIMPSDAAFEVRSHPMVTRHPRTGRPALFVNPVYTTGIEGMDPVEAQTLLQRLYQHSVHPNLTCRLRWRPKMLTIWDNRATQHFAINDYSGQRRQMFRTSVRGETPAAA
jgi:taurine dioxygenase